MSPRHFRINQNDLERLKEEIAIDMRNKIQKLSQRWFMNDKIRQKQINVWSNSPSSVNAFDQQQNTLFGNPQFRELVYQQVYNQENREDGQLQQQKVEEIESSIQKQKRVINALKEELQKIEEQRVDQKCETKDAFDNRFK